MAQFIPVLQPKPRFHCLQQWKPNLWDRCWRLRKEVWFRCQQPGRWGLLPQSPSQHLSVGWGFYSEGEGQGEQRGGGEAVDLQAVSSLVPIWIINVCVLELVRAAWFLQLGDLHELESRWRLFLVQAGTGAAGACNMLTKKLWVLFKNSVSSFFISFLVHLIVIPFMVIQSSIVFIPCYSTKGQLFLNYVFVAFFHATISFFWCRDNMKRALAFTAPIPMSQSFCM